MSAADSLMWQIERDPLLRSTITAVSLLDRPPDWDGLRRRVERVAHDVPRLRQHVVGSFAGLGNPVWRHDPNFELGYHLRRRRLRPPLTFHEALVIASTSAMSSFDKSRPLWEFEVVEGLAGGQAMLIQKIHHSVADGIAGLRLAAALLDLERTPPGPAEPPDAPAEPDPPPSPGRNWSPVPLVATGLRVGTSSLTAAGRAVRSPPATVAGLLDSARWARRLVAPVRSPMSTVMLGRGTSLSFDTFDVELARLRAAATAAGCKLNDAYIAAVVRGLARYHEEHGKPVSALRMTMPISIRSADDPVASNRFSPVRFVVPVVESALVEQVRQVRDISGAWRDGPALGLTDVLARGLNSLPAPLATSIFGQMLKNVDFVATNVRGYPAPLYLAGAEVLRLYAFAPPSGAALNVALISHVDKCCIGVNVDRRAVPDPEVMTACLQAGFGEVLGLGSLGRRRTTTKTGRTRQA
jgi:WS/DGAT/MGAT family acyltransferase